ncbi:hypothetical protein Tsubulata_027753 [Turnera subulata]|uniref:DUF4283 domain-containing protein n=1 Tax=Turnera subulata TaxID=218843 RepID=A0A9Q0GAY2_9ROSI|nr:hypothetical protein Tsubulata_027753 [Turnera subulata]
MSQKGGTNRVRDIGSQETSIRSEVARKNVDHRLRSSFFLRFSKEFIQRAIEDRRVVSVFVENIPSRWSSIDLLHELSRASRIMDIFISGKLSGDDIRYGRDLRIVVVSWKNPFESVPGNGNLGETVAGGGIRGQLYKGVSFAQAADIFDEGLPAIRACKLGVSNPKSVAGSVSNIVFEPKSDWLNRFKTYAFGVLSEGVIVEEVEQCLSSKIKQDIGIKLIEGPHVLLKFKSRDSMITCVESEEVWNWEFFYLLKKWENGDGTSHRHCMLNIYGVPPIAWCDDFFSQIAIRFGSFIGLHNQINNSSHLTVAKVHISTTCVEPIKRDFRLSIGDRCFDIFVVEAQPMYALDRSFVNNLDVLSNKNGGSSSRNSCLKEDTYFEALLDLFWAK